MDWSASTWWWIAAAVLVAGELATGTFYVLMLALGCVVGALAGYVGISFFAQVIVAVVVGGAAVPGMHVIAEVRHNELALRRA